MVAMQCMVVVGFVGGTAWPACGSSDQCHQAGMFCAVGTSDRCGTCGAYHPLPSQTDLATGGVLNAPWDPDFVGFNLTAVAELCAKPSSYAYKLGSARVAYQRKGRQEVELSPTTSSIISWCKSSNDALDLFIP